MDVTKNFDRKIFDRKKFDRKKKGWHVITFASGHRTGPDDRFRDERNELTDRRTSISGPSYTIAPSGQKSMFLVDILDHLLDNTRRARWPRRDYCVGESRRD